MAKNKVLSGKNQKPSAELSHGNPILGLIFLKFWIFSPETSIKLRAILIEKNSEHYKVKPQDNCGPNADNFGKTRSQNFVHYSIL